MSEQVLDSSRAVGQAAAALAHALAAPEGVAQLHAVCWPAGDPESLRGAALLGESRLSAEPLDRLRRDHHRLFVGGTDRGPIAPPDVPAGAAPSLARLRREVTRTGLRVPVAGATAVAEVLLTWADLLTAPAEHEAQAARVRAELLEEHLLTWGVRCLSRAQLGAQTFLYQGVATLGLGILRHAAADSRRRTCA